MKSITRQTGVALILSLLLLFVLTLIAVASFSSSHVQERAASNAILQTKAFEAAAAGASTSVEFYALHGDEAPDTLCGSTGHEGWYVVPDDPTSLPYATDWVEDADYASSVPNVKLWQRMYCLVPSYKCDKDEVGCDTGTIKALRSQLFVENRGEAWVGQNVAAIRNIEVRVDRKVNTWTAKGCGAICLAACDYKYDWKGEPAIDMPTSKNFYVYGVEGPSITTSNCLDKTLLDEVVGDIQDQKLVNYDGPMSAQDPGEPWNDPNKTEVFREAVQTEAGTDGNILITTGDLGPSPTMRLDDSTLPPLFTETGNGIDKDTGDSYYGSENSPVITYIEGDFESKGVISGAGILMVQGDIIWNGNNDYQGLVVSLGGSFTIAGGGDGGVLGTVVVLNSEELNDDGSFGPVSLENVGGGGGVYQYDCKTLLEAFRSVGGYDSQDSFENSSEEFPWGHDCDRGEETA
jgi:Tfp pilus assembly protein PilX